MNLPTKGAILFGSSFAGAMCGFALGVMLNLALALTALVFGFIFTGTGDWFMAVISVLDEFARTGGMLGIALAIGICLAIEFIPTKPKKKKKYYQNERMKYNKKFLKKKKDK